ncbi:MAG TPA: polymer-forming cytoskeletal protein [Tissierellaceae bacterium]|nr:polymer-forming cytoskeletal protein [Tissierellaceae bacterium]
MLNIKNKNNIKTVALISLFFAIISISFGSVLAENIRGGNVLVESDKTLEKTSFLSGDNVRIDGNINGTTFVSSENIEVNGIIDGDLFAVGQNIIVNGTVTGNLVTASKNITINGVVENNVYLAGAIIKIKSQINGSAFLAGQNVYIEDKAIIGRDAFVGAYKIYQNGVIDGDLVSGSRLLSVHGKIGGDLHYSSQNKAEFSNESKVLGKIKWGKHKPKVTKSMSSFDTLIRVILSTLAPLVVWIFVKLIRPTFWINLTQDKSDSPFKILGFGILALIFIPIVSLLLMITNIGIPLGLILLALYIIINYISKIILSLFITYWLQSKYDWSNSQAFWLFLLGLTILTILDLIPMVGWFFSLIIVSFGHGSIILSMKEIS